VTAFLSVEQVIAFHDDNSDAPLRDRGRLEAAVMRPQAEFGGVFAHPTLWAQAAALLHGIDRAQAFADGNKRTAWTSAVVFLAANGFALRVSQEEMFAFMKDVGSGAAGDVPEIALWLFERATAA